MTNPVPERTSVVCPHCHKRLQVPVTLLGKTGKCPACTATFTIVAAAPTSAQAPAQSLELRPLHDPLFVSASAPSYPLQQATTAPAGEAELPKNLFAKIMSVVGSLIALCAVAAVQSLVRLAMRENGSRARIALVILFVVGGGGITVFFGSKLIYIGVNALITRRFPLTTTRQITGVLAQLGGVFFIVCGIAFVMSMVLFGYVVFHEMTKKL